MKRLLKKFGPSAAPATELRTMQSEGAAGAKAKLKLAS